MFEDIQKLEKALTDPNVRQNRQRLNEILADDFEEIGKSGAKFSKESIINALAESTHEPFSARNYKYISLSASSVLVTYETVLGDEIARRCSIWVKADNRWQIRYHQGTPVPNDKAMQ